eukprot:SAG11_NODE_6859_length_1234_cov_3.194714_1_plen_306_part_01
MSQQQQAWAQQQQLAAAASILGAPVEMEGHMWQQQQAWAQQQQASLAHQQWMHQQACEQWMLHQQACAQYHAQQAAAAAAAGGSSCGAPAEYYVHPGAIVLGQMGQRPVVYGVPTAKRAPTEPRKKTKVKIMGHDSTEVKAPPKPTPEKKLDKLKEPHVAPAKKKLEVVSSKKRDEGGETGGDDEADDFSFGGFEDEAAPKPRQWFGPCRPRRGGNAKEAHQASPHGTEAQVRAARAGTRRATRKRRTKLARTAREGKERKKERTKERKKERKTSKHASSGCCTSKHARNIMRNRQLPLPLLEVAL